MLPSIWNYCQICNSPFFICFVFKAVSFFFFMEAPYLESPIFLLTSVLCCSWGYLASFPLLPPASCVLVCCVLSIFFSQFCFTILLFLSLDILLGRGLVTSFSCVTNAVFSESVNACFGGKGFFLF